MAPAGVTDTCRLPSDPPPGADTQATTRPPPGSATNIGVAPFSVSCEITRAGVKRVGLSAPSPPHAATSTAAKGTRR